MAVIGVHLKILELTLPLQPHQAVPTGFHAGRQIFLRESLDSLMSFVNFVANHSYHSVIPQGDERVALRIDATGG